MFEVNYAIGKKSVRHVPGIIIDDVADIHCLIRFRRLLSPTMEVE